VIDFRSIIDEKKDFVIVSIEIPFDLRDNAIIDIETTGLDPSEHEIVSYGICLKNVYTVVARAWGSDRLMRRFAKTYTKLLHNLGFRLYAWYKEFEEEWLGIEFNELQIRRYEKKDRSLYWGIEIPAQGSDIPRLWREWQTQRNIVSLNKIIQRNMYDILIETASLLRRPYLLLA